MNLAAENAKIQCQIASTAKHQNAIQN